MALVDVLDDTFVRADVRTVREQTGGCWESWLPGLALQVRQDRGQAGVRWSATGVGDPDLVGSAEVWLEAVPRGTVVHLFVRLDRAGRGVPRRTRRLPDRLRRTWKRELHRWKDHQEQEHPTWPT